jgi:hypothetical protein
MSKCAYSLIYINQKVASQLEEMPLMNFSSQEVITSAIKPELKKHVIDTNMKFDKELIDYQVEKIGK